MEINIEKSNFGHTEIHEFFKLLKGQWLWAINNHGNIEFAYKNDIGSTLACIYRLCFNKVNGKYYFAYTRGWSRGYLFNTKTSEFVVPRPIHIVHNGVEGEFSADPDFKTVSRPQMFDDVVSAAIRFNKYAEKHILD